MDYLPEISLAAVIVICIIIYIIIRYPWNKSRKVKLLLYYREIRTRSLQLQEKLTHKILEQNLADTEFIHGMTYNDYLKGIKHNHIKNLSEKQYIRLKKSNSPATVKKIQKMIKQQENYINTVETEIVNNLK